LFQYHLDHPGISTLHILPEDFTIAFNMSNVQLRVGVNQPPRWLLGGKGLGIQQGTSVWVGSPKSQLSMSNFKELQVLEYTIERWMSQ
jgi:hypothetical protein